MCCVVCLFLFLCFCTSFDIIFFLPFSNVLFLLQACWNLMLQYICNYIKKRRKTFVFFLCNNLQLNEIFPPFFRLWSTTLALIFWAIQFSFLRDGQSTVATPILFKNNQAVSCQAKLLCLNLYTHILPYARII